MSSPSYKKPPIAEAIVELRFADGLQWSSSQNALLEAFEKTHPGPRRELKSFQLQAEWKDGAVSTSTDGQFSRWLLPNEAATELVGLGPDVLSIHVIAPYPGWGAFRPAIDRAFSQYAAVAKPGRLALATVRYVDQILLPKDADFDDYFLALPRRLKSQPKGLEGFQVTTEAIDAEDRIRSRLTLVSGPLTGDGRRVVVYDLDVRHQFADLAAADSWPEMVELLHARQKAMFEESITDQTRGLFQ